MTSNRLTLAVFLCIIFFLSFCSCLIAVFVRYFCSAITFLFCFELSHGSAAFFIYDSYIKRPVIERMHTQTSDTHSRATPVICIIEMRMELNCDRSSFTVRQKAFNIILWMNQGIRANIQSGFSQSSSGQDNQYGFCTGTAAYECSFMEYHWTGTSSNCSCFRAIRTFERDGRTDPIDSIVPN